MFEIRQLNVRTKELKLYLGLYLKETFTKFNFQYDNVPN